MATEVMTFTPQSTIRQVLAGHGEEGKQMLYRHGYDVGEGFSDTLSQYQTLQNAARAEQLRDLGGLLAMLNRKQVALRPEYKAALDKELARLTTGWRWSATDLSAWAQEEAAGGGSLEMLLARMKPDPELEAGAEYVYMRVESVASGKLDEAGQKALRLLAKRAAAEALRELRG